MIYDELKVQIHDAPRSHEKQIYIYWTRPEYDMVLQANGTVVEIKPGESIDPTFTLRPEILQALFEELAKKGMKLPEKSLIEGKLQASERHLQDIQAILKAVLPSALKEPTHANRKRNIHKQ